MWKRCHVSSSAAILVVLFAAQAGCNVGQKDVFTLTNIHGVQVRMLSYGGSVTSIRVPDSDGPDDDSLLGYDTADGYMKNNSPFFGAIIGRYGNRIAKGIFTLDGQTFHLATNNAPNHLHGGNRGFDKVVWQGKEFRNADSTGVVFTHTSP